MNQNTIKQEFITSFNLPQDQFTKPTELENKIGFSTQKALSSRLRRKLGIPSDKTYVSLIYASIDENQLEKEELIPIKLRISFTEKRNEEFIITDEHIRNKKYKPIELISNDDYFFNHKEKTFTSRTKEIEAIDILNELYENHTKTTNTISWIRIRIWFWRSMTASIFRLAAKALEILLEFTSGEKVKFSFIEGRLETVTDQKKPVSTEEQKKTKSSEPINFFGYKVEKETIFSYACIHITIYTILFINNTKPIYLTQIFKNNFLTVNYIVVSLGLYEHIFEKIMPPRLKNTIKKLWENYYKLKFKEIKI